LLGMNLWQWALKKVTRIHSAHLSEDEWYTESLTSWFRTVFARVLFIWCSPVLICHERSRNEKWSGIPVTYISEEEGSITWIGLLKWSVQFDYGSQTSRITRIRWSADRIDGPHHFSIDGTVKSCKPLSMCLGVCVWHVGHFFAPMSLFVQFTLSLIDHG
jgi:hypothetical protein